MRGLAYSYLRFSTPDQALGDSRRRQLVLAENYAEQHGLLLDRGLNFRDLGVSALRGRNAKQGGLRAFLDAVEHSLLPPSSTSAFSRPAVAQQTSYGRPRPGLLGSNLRWLAPTRLTLQPLRRTNLASDLPHVA